MSVGPKCWSCYITLSWSNVTYGVSGRAGSSEAFSGAELTLLRRFPPPSTSTKRVVTCERKGGEEGGRKWEGSTKCQYVNGEIVEIFFVSLFFFFLLRSKKIDWRLGEKKREKKEILGEEMSDGEERSWRVRFFFWEEVPFQCCHLTVRVARSFRQILQFLFCCTARFQAVNKFQRPLLACKNKKSFFFFWLGSVPVGNPGDSYYYPTHPYPFLLPGEKQWQHWHQEQERKKNFSTNK